MRKLVHWMDLRHEDPDRIESPFFAEPRVEDLLMSRGRLDGLDELLRSCGVYSLYNFPPESKREVLAKIRKGDWLLITERPVKPLVSYPDDYYPWLSMVLARNREEGSVGTGMVRTEQQGPGKWRTVNVKKHAGVNVAVIFSNRITSMGDEGRLFGSDGKDFANTVQTVTQQWVPLDAHDAYMKHSSVVRIYGVTRNIEQRYLEGDDHWQISGKSWQWTPAVANEVYEARGGGN
ncbi:hypothetical protein [Pseudomonas japonica]|uniref:Uncharacterized protein n=1 Tax=Pseudomonas japonica TaxID=256466 RepID=A0A239AUU1_9PSED|nr:hypothetical protein [Pseudomonas japonica]SNR98728.1 hypothetical protein SAMN05444352_10269 [Pseudomonas japonica]